DDLCIRVALAGALLELRTVVPSKRLLLLHGDSLESVTTFARGDVFEILYMRKRHVVEHRQLPAIDAVSVPEQDDLREIAEQGRLIIERRLAQTFELDGRQGF